MSSVTSASFGLVPPSSRAESSTTSSSFISSAVVTAVFKSAPFLLRFRRFFVSVSSPIVLVTEAVWWPGGDVVRCRTQQPRATSNEQPWPPCRQPLYLFGRPRHCNTQYPKCLTSFGRCCRVRRDRSIRVSMVASPCLYLGSWGPSPLMVSKTVTLENRVVEVKRIISPAPKLEIAPPTLPGVLPQ